MINTKELRIGNLVYGWIEEDDKDYICEVDCIDNVDVTENGLWISGVASSHEYYDEIKPIPITEDWLLKFGFTRFGDEGEYFEHVGLPALEFLNQGDSFKVFANDFILTNIKHVHQLQNTYFVLTGEELTIKL